MFLIYPFMAVGSLLAMVLSVLLFNWWVVLFAKKDDQGQLWLPRWCSYFQTFDTPLPGGYRANVAWLNRNPGYGFDYYVFGMRWNPEDWTVRVFRSDATRDFFIATSRNGGFNFYYLGPRGMFKFGWKAWNNFTDGKFNSNFGDGSHVPTCISWNPLKHKE